MIRPELWLPTLHRAQALGETRPVKRPRTRDAHLRLLLNVSLLASATIVHGDDLAKNHSPHMKPGIPFRAVFENDCAAFWWIRGANRRIDRRFRVWVVQPTPFCIDPPVPTLLTYICLLPYFLGGFSAQVRLTTATAARKVVAFHLITFHALRSSFVSPN